MEKRTYPKLNILELSKYIGELFLASEGSIEWIKEKRVLIVWHTIFLSLLLFVASILFIHLIIIDSFQNSITFTYFYRLALLFFFVVLAIMFIVLMYRYYKYLLLTSKDLRLQSIVLFASIFCMIFAWIYIRLYFLDSSLFIYSDPILPPSPLFITGELISKYTMFADFIMYSASIATNIEYPRIASASPVISLVNIVQSIVSLILIALVISTFVQKSGQKKIFSCRIKIFLTKGLTGGP